MSEWLLLLGQSSPPAGSQPAAGGDPSTIFWGLLLAMGVYFVIMARGQRKDRRRHEEFLKNLKRGDRVQTIGGVYGTIVDTREHEVVLKVDETSNVKMRFNRTAIKEVITAQNAAADNKSSS